MLALIHIEKVESFRRKHMRKLSTRVAAAAVALMPAVALAQETLPTPISSPGDFITLLGTVASWMFTIFLALAVLFLIYAAFLYLTAAGNESRVGNAKNVLIYSVVAIVIALLAGGIVPLIRGVIEGT